MTILTITDNKVLFILICIAFILLFYLWFLIRKQLIELMEMGNL